jgi:hypothetical protein
MDPNATLREIDAALELSRPWNTWRAEARRHKAALLHWLKIGGFEPNWRIYPDATVYCGRPYP